MSETTTGTAAKARDAAKVEEKPRHPEPAQGGLDGFAGDATLLDALLRSSVADQRLDKHAALLSDPRFSHSANSEQKAQMVSGLQTAHGNAYVQRVLESRVFRAKPTVNLPAGVSEGVGKTAESRPLSVGKTPLLPRRHGLFAAEQLSICDIAAGSGHDLSIEAAAPLVQRQEKEISPGVAQDEAARKAFLDSIKLAVWPEPQAGNLDWVVDRMKIYLTPYSDHNNPGLSFSTVFAIGPRAYFDEAPITSDERWPEHSTVGGKHGLSLKGAGDFALEICLFFSGLDEAERPTVKETIHVTDKRPGKQPELGTVKVGGVETRSRYKVVRGELFVADPLVSPEEIRPEDVDQEFLGTCYFLASLAAVARDHPEVIRRMVKDNENGTYTVTFYEDKNWFGKPNYQPHEETVDNKLPFLAQDGPDRYVSAQPVNFSAAGPELWVAIVEKAYARWKGGYPDIEGGRAINALPEITGAEAKAYDPGDLLPQDLMDKLDSALAAGQPVVANASQTRFMAFVDWLAKTVGQGDIEQMREQQDVYYSHAYTVMDVDTKGLSIQLRNPWGSSHPRLGVETFQQWFSSFVIGQVR